MQFGLNMECVDLSSLFCRRLVGDTLYANGCYANALLITTSMGNKSGQVNDMGQIPIAVLRLCSLLRRGFSVTFVSVHSVPQGF